MSKKLNIIEAMKMPIGTEFEVVYKDGAIDSIKVTLKAPNGIKFLEWNSGNIVLANNGIIDATFIPIQQPVSFMEAIESYSKGKIIKSTEEIDGQIFTHIYVPDGIADCIEDDSRCAMTSREILNGKWYIEESEEQN